MTLLHICTPGEWQSAQASGEYRAPSLETEGFIHCSTPAQVADTALLFYHGRANLCLLVIDAHKAQSEIKYELASNGGTYPHIYGPLNVSAVTDVVPFPPNADGTFTLPRCLK